MPNFKNGAKISESRGLPSQLVDQINARQASGEYDDDERFKSQKPTGKKRKAALTRKDKRKEERQLKKQKQRGSNKSRQEPDPAKSTKTKQKPDSRSNSSLTTTEADDPLEQLRRLKEAKRNKQEKTAEFSTKENSSDHLDPLEQLRRLKEGKTGSRSGNTQGIRIVKEDDLDDDNDGSELEQDDYGDESEEFQSGDDLEGDEEDPLEALRLLKEKKRGGNKATSELRIVKEHELENDDVDSDSGEESEFAGFEEEEDDDDDEDEDGNVVNGKVQKIAPPKSILKTKVRPDAAALGGDFSRDDADIAYYAKKLGLKDGANAKLQKEGDDDMIGGILDGLDLEFGSDDSAEENGFGNHSEEEEQESLSGSDSEDFDEEQIGCDEDPLKKLKELKEAKKCKARETHTKISSNPDSRFNDGDDDEDLEYYAKKLGVSKNDPLPKTSEDDPLEGLLDGLDFGFHNRKEDLESEPESDGSLDDKSDYESDESDTEYKTRENPFVAPGSDEDGGATSTESQKYIPPALRRKIALEGSGEDSSALLNLRRSIKGPLNKLSEGNINTIVNELQALFMSNPRQVLNEEITSVTLDSVIQQGRLLDSFVHLHAAVVAALYRLHGVEFGAFFIQKLVENLQSHRKQESKTKETSNLVSLMSAVYSFHLISSKLLYDLIKQLIAELNEANADLLLRVIQNSGNQMRSDDPSSLKDIILLLNDKYASLPSVVKNARVQFLVETISSLKNNKLKVLNQGTQQLAVRLRKFLSGINNNLGGDPIQVSLEDIENVESRGKWWLVGSAWKGNDNSNGNSLTPVVNEAAMNDILDAAEPNWMQLAKAQRMNTDIRRAVFISIMSATDYLDARAKLDKLALKRSQERDIPKVLIHCTTMEPSWNPYYGILANNLCDSHSFRKTFQFMFWDLVKELDGRAGGNDDDDDDDEGVSFMSLDENSDEESKMKKIVNLGRFYGFLLAENALPLHSLKTMNFISASADTGLFAEVLLVTFLDLVGKKSRKNSVGAGMELDKSSSYDALFDDRLLVERVLKAKDEITLLRGLQYVLQEKVKNSDVISGRKQKIRVSWGVDAMFDVIDELLRNAEQEY
ncbi:uncharacterized protein LODBEIA_P08020 [Lodderomyces beijingensis]|uniref:MI domain-containing protein n=1 Tax=Lodderomyces beijingensis TaxID=1775926 RepID=A0ABP0ZEJ7_9ASCO